jgi:hypothetical protein
LPAALLIPQNVGHNLGRLSKQYECHMKKINISIFGLLISIIGCYAQQSIKTSMTIGTNYGFFDRYSGRGPVLISEFNLKFSSYVEASPHLLLAFGNSDHEYISMSIPEHQYSSTTTVEPGLVIKIIPMAYIDFDRLKLIAGLTYLYEITTLSNTESVDNWNSQRFDKGLNLMIGIDMDIIKFKNYRLGIDWRINTSPNRVLLYHFGLITNFSISN